LTFFSCMLSPNIKPDFLRPRFSRLFLKTNFQGITNRKYHLRALKPYCWLKMIPPQIQFKWNKTFKGRISKIILKNISPPSFLLLFNRESRLIKSISSLSVWDFPSFFTRNSSFRTKDTDNLHSWDVSSSKQSLPMIQSLRK